MAARPTGMTLRELLAAAPPRHRRAVAAAVGAQDESAAALARALGEERRLAELVAALPAAARAAATRLAFASPAQVHSDATAAFVELERHGLAFAFGERWWRRYALPSDLEAPLRRVRAAAHARLVPAREASAARWIAAPAQTAHDAAALWGFLARTPARVKTDGEIYVRTWPKLYAALPPIAGIDASGFETMRADLALELLRDSGALRLRVGDRPGQDERRELTADGDLPATLDAEAATLANRMEAERASGHAVAAALARALEGRAVALAPLGKALKAILDEVGLGSWGRHGDATRALSALGPLWLAGGIQLGANARGEPIAARFAAPEQAGAGGPLGVCQSNFELICLRPPAPSERALLELAAEAVEGQAHVFRVTRGSVRCAARMLGSGGARAGLERLVGELPQNVERSISDWERGVRPPLRLRSAIFLDAGDAAAADALAAGPLAGLVADRLGETLLAVRSQQVDDAERALARAGHELEPGLERVSGSWLERPDGSGEARALWAPQQATGQGSPDPPGKLVSTIGEGAGAQDATSRKRPTPADPGGPSGLAAEAESLTAILRALEQEADVEIVYAGKRGLTERRITPLAIEGSALRAWCHLRGDERSFWLASVRHAALAQD